MRQHIRDSLDFGVPIETHTLLGTNRRFCGRRLSRTAAVPGRAGGYRSPPLKNLTRSPLRSRISQQSKGIVAPVHRCADNIGAPRDTRSMRLLKKSRTKETFTILTPMALTMTPKLSEPAT